MKTIHRTILSTMFIGSACSEFPDVEDLLPQDTHGQTSQHPPGDWPELSTTQADSTDWPDSGSGSTTGDPSNATTTTDSENESMADTHESNSATSQDPEDTKSTDDTGSSSSTASDESGDEIEGCQSLQISEFMANPEGKDGSAEGPEWVEIQNRSVSSVSLHGCVLESRSWPVLSLENLDVQTDELQAGQRLTIYRFNKSITASSLPDSTSDRIDIAFHHNSGLRNADGAIGIRDAQGKWVDLVVYGGPAVAPFDDLMAWEGAATSSPTSGQTLCRSADTLDSNTASDWYTCPPSPGQANPKVEGDENPDDNDSDSDTTSSTETTESTDTTTDDPGDEDSSETTTSSETSEPTHTDSDTDNEATTDSPDTESDTNSETDPNSDDTSDGDAEDSSDTGDSPDFSIVISTVLSNPVGPASEDKFHEYVDIVNIGSDEVSLQGWTIADDLDIEAKGIDPILYRSGTGGCATEDLCLAPGRRARIAGSEYIQSEAAPDLLILQTDDTTIADGGMTALEPILLRDSTSTIRSSYRSWPDPKADPNPSQTESAISRIELEGADIMENWQFVSRSKSQRQSSVISTSAN